MPKIFKIVGVGNNDNQPSTSKQAAAVSQQQQNINLECLLVENTSISHNCIPYHLWQLLQHYKQNTEKLTQAEILFLLIYAISLECGFAGLNEYHKCASELKRLPPMTVFNSKNVARVSREMPTYTYNKNKEKFCMHLHSICHLPYGFDQNQSLTIFNSLMTAFVSGDFFIVTLGPEKGQNNQGFSICLSIERYVLSLQAKGQPIYKRFRKLKELSVELKDNLFMARRSQQMQLLEVCIYPGLDGLPIELYDKIFKHLSLNQINCMANVNKLFNCCVSDYRTKRMKNTHIQIDDGEDDDNFSIDFLFG